MSTKTTNFNLIKPSLNDAADITAFNSNWDKIDEQLKKAGETGGSDLTGTEACTEVSGSSPTVDPTIQNYIAGEIDDLRQSFQDGCDTIVATITTCGQGYIIPESNSPSDISKAIEDLTIGAYNVGMLDISNDYVLKEGYFDTFDSERTSTLTYTATEDTSVYVHSSVYRYKKNDAGTTTVTFTDGEPLAKKILMDNVRLLKHGDRDGSLWGYAALFTIKKGQTITAELYSSGGSTGASFGAGYIAIVKI